MKTKTGIISFFLSICFFATLIFNPGAFKALAQSEEASLILPGVQQFFDNNGNPLNSGKVYFYEVGTTTFKDTYTSSAATTLNVNPITLNAGGKAPTGGIWGIGTYRQVVRDRNGNLIWDAVTTTAGGSGTTPTEVGDGNLVGTVLPWSGLVAPNQYVFAYGQELARASYPEFYTAITLQANVICSAASNVLSGIADTTQIPIGAPVEVSLCLAPGTTVVSKTSSSVTVSNPSGVSISTTAKFFPWGNGDGSTTFNVPDYRGVVFAGRTNMGGTASSNLTATYYGISPNALGAIGGAQSKSITIAQANLPSVNLTTSIASGQGSHSHSFSTYTGQQPTFSDTQSGAGAQRLTPSSGGNSYSIANATLPSMTGTTPLGGSGTAITFSAVQPTVTINYIIKVTPDTSTSIATGVYSIGGMTGVISCGSGILCTGNIISFNGSSFIGGADTEIQVNSGGVFTGYPAFTFISPDNLVLGVSGTGAPGSGVRGLFDIAGSTSGRVRQTVLFTAGTPTVTWGNSSGTPAVTASAPLAINSTTGDISCPTCTTGVSASALTRVDDTNVTLTLGGFPSTALLSATSLTLGWTGTLAAGRLNSNVVQSVTNDTNVTGSISAQDLTLGWTGQLAVARGGTGLSSGISGGVLYFNSTSTLSSSAALTANQLMIGGGAGAAPSTIACATSTTVLHGGSPPTCSQIVAADITTNTITNSNLAQTASVTLKGNPTASTADVIDFTLDSLTQTVSPNSTDWILILDAGTSTFKKINAGTIASASVAGVSSLNGLTGGLTIANGQAIQSIGASGSTITISADVATSSDYFAGTSNKLLDASVVYSTETTTTYGSTTTFSADTFVNTAVTLTGNISTVTFSSIKAGQCGNIRFIQDGTGGRTLPSTFNANFRWQNGVQPLLSTAANSVDLLSFCCMATNYCVGNMMYDIKATP